MHASARPSLPAASPCLRSVAERVRRVEEAGITEAYAAMLDTKALG